MVKFYTLLLVKIQVFFFKFLKMEVMVTLQVSELSHLFVILTLTHTAQDNCSVAF